MNMSVKRLFLAVSLFALGTIAFGQTSLVFWAGAEEPGLERLFEKYEEENPGVDLALEVVPYGNYAQKIVAASRTNTLPDVLLLQPKVPATFAELDVLAPVTDIVSDLGGEDEFFSRDVGFNTLNGDIWGIPFYVYPHVLFYRKSVLEQSGVSAPSSWSEFQNAAELTTSSDMFGYLAFFNDPVAHTLHQWMATNNADTFNADLEITFDSENTIETLQFLKDLWDAGVIPPGATTYNQGDARVGFVNNQAAMMITSTSFLDNLVNEAPDMVADIGIARIPTNKSDGTYYAFRSIGLSKDNPDQEEAVKFVKWLFQPENLVIYFENTKLGYMPMTRSLQDSDAYWQSETIAPYADLIRPALGAASNGFFPGLNEQINPYAGLFETQDVYRGALMDVIVFDADPAQAVEKAAELMLEIMGR